MRRIDDLFGMEHPRLHPAQDPRDAGAITGRILGDPGERPRLVMRQPQLAPLKVAGHAFPRDRGQGFVAAVAQGPQHQALLFGEEAGLGVRDLSAQIGKMLPVDRWRARAQDLFGPQQDFAGKGAQRCKRHDDRPPGSLVAATIGETVRFRFIPPRRQTSLSPLGGVFCARGHHRAGDRNLANAAVSAALRYRAQAPVIDGLMRELGFEGGTLDALVSGAEAGATEPPARPEAAE